MTNDTEYGARAHLDFSRDLGHFEFVAGFDSGHRRKARAGAAAGLCDPGRGSRLAAWSWSVTAPMT